MRSAWAIDKERGRVGLTEISSECSDLGRGPCQHAFLHLYQHTCLSFVWADESLGGRERGRDEVSLLLLLIEHQDTNDDSSGRRAQIPSGAESEASLICPGESVSIRESID